MKTVTIIVDTREQNPLPVPAVVEWLDPNCLPTEPVGKRVMLKYVRQTLQVADYMLEGDPGGVYLVKGVQGAGCVERKASIDELSDNVFSPVRRPSFIKLLTRMKQQWHHPLLVIEGGLSTLSRPSRKHDRGLIIDGLIRLTQEYGVPIQLVDGRGLQQRSFLGEFVVRWLLNATLRAGYNSPVTEAPPHESIHPSSESSTSTPLAPGPAH